MRQLHWQAIQEQFELIFDPPMSGADKAQLRAAPTCNATIDLASSIVAKETFALAVGISSRDQIVSRTFGISGQVAGAARAIATYAVFGLRGPRIYKLARDFGQALSKVRCNIPPKYLRFDNEIYCIEFPDDLEFDIGDGDFARCAYVGMYTRNDAMIWPSKANGDTGKWVMDITVPLYRENGMLGGNDNVRLYLSADDDLHEVLRVAQGQISLGGRTGMSHELLTYIVNSLLYINSGEPDLRHLRPTPKPRHRDHKKALKLIEAWRHGGGDVFCPMTLVGFDYKKPRVYTAGEGLVVGHWRWQPCGPGRAVVRLTWVREHTRTYNKSDQDIVVAITEPQQP